MPLTVWPLAGLQQPHRRARVSPAMHPRYFYVGCPSCHNPPYFPDQGPNIYIICNLFLVMFLHCLTLHKKNKNLCCLPLSNVGVDLKRTNLACKWLWQKSVVLLDQSRCSKWRPFAFTHARSCVCHFVDDALRNTIPSVNASASVFV